MIISKISQIRPSPKIADALSVCFYLIFALLLAKFVIDLNYFGSIDISETKPLPPLFAFINRLARVFSEPFDNSPAMALLSYSICYFGMNLEISEERKDFFMNKILDVCRAFFYVAAALLILLGVIRMSVLLYQDFRYGSYRPAIIKVKENKE